MLSVNQNAFGEILSVNHDKAVIDSRIHHLRRVLRFNFDDLLVPQQLFTTIYFHRVPNSLPVALLTALAEECILESPSPIETIMWKIKRLVTVCS